MVKKGELLELSQMTKHVRLVNYDSPRWIQGGAPVEETIG